MVLYKKTASNKDLFSNRKADVDADDEEYVIKMNCIVQCCKLYKQMLCLNK